MSDPDTSSELDRLPDESTIATLRTDAEADGASIETTFPAADGSRKRLVVSPRGTVVVLTDVTEATYNRSQSPAEIAEDLQE